MKHRHVRVIDIFVILLAIGLTVLTGLNIKIANEAKEIEKRNYDIYYAYDRINTVADRINSATLLTEKISAQAVDFYRGQYIVRFSNTYFGTLEIIFPNALQNETKMHIILSEAENKEGKPWTRTDMNTATYGFGICYYDTNVTVPEGTKIYRVELPERPLPIVRAVESYSGGVLPFYICSLTGYYEERMTEENFYQIAVHVPFDDSAGVFTSDNAELNGLFDFCKQTVKSTSYAGIYVDGYREMAPYEADAYINELGHFSVDNNYEIAKATLEYLVNYHTWPTEWILQTIPLAYEYYIYSGDLELLEEIYPRLQDCLMECIINNDGLLDSSLIDDEVLRLYGVSGIRDIIDWPVSERDHFQTNVDSKVKLNDKLKYLSTQYRAFVADISGCHYTACLWRVNSGTGGDITTIATPNAVVNAFYYDGLVNMAEIAEAIDSDEMAEFYKQKAKRFRALYQETFIDKRSGLVIDAVGSAHTSLHAQIFALDFDLVPEENKKAIIEHIKSKGMACSVYASQFLLESLIKNGEPEYAIGLMTDKTEKSWYNMIHNTGSKLTTEAWNESIKPNQDWNHAWSTAPVNVIMRYIVGVRPVKGGCKW